MARWIRTWRLDALCGLAVLFSTRLGHLELEGDEGRRKGHFLACGSQLESVELFIGCNRTRRTQTIK